MRLGNQREAPPGDFRQALRRPRPQADFRAPFVVGFRAGFAAFGEASAFEPPLAFTSAA